MEEYAETGVERFALEQAKYMTCRFLQHFDEITATDSEGNAITHLQGSSWVDHVKYHVGLTMSPDAGVWLRLVPSRTSWFPNKDS